jgi:phosphoribosyl 1,2-cyclic phosphate phosphodiesterase
VIKVTILGCGASLGVPVVGCSCKVCTSGSRYNKRRRSAIIISNTTTRILIDFGFDIKDQLVDAGISWLTASILTHDHADHMSGADNLRVFSHREHQPLSIYTTDDASSRFMLLHGYLVDTKQLNVVPIDFYEKMRIGDLDVMVFKQFHGDKGFSLGIRVNNFVYSIDVSSFPVESEKYLQDVDVWVLDCLQYAPNHKHLSMKQVLEYQEKYRPRQIYLTSMSHAIDYFDISPFVYDSIFPCFDGMEIYIK